MDIEALKPQIHSWAEKHNLEFVVLFGSQATGRTHAASDIDIAVISKQELNIPRLMREASELFEREDVEIVDLGRASPTMMYAVVQEGKLLYEAKPDGFLSWKFYAIKIWMETAWLRDLRDKRLIEWANT